MRLEERKRSGAVPAFIRATVCLLQAVVFIFSVPYAGAAPEAALTVAAASSLSFSMKEAAASFEKKSGARVTVSFGSTGILSSQIRNGAPFDLFFSADIDHVEKLAEEGHLVPESVRVYALGRVVLVVNTRTHLKVTGLQVLLDPGVRRVAVANPDHAPYGAAAVEALKAAGIYEEVRTRLVYGENIRQALRFVQTGNAEAGLVARSVAGAPGVRLSEIAPELYSPIEQAAGVVASSEAKALALEFMDFMTGPDGAAIMERYGFVKPGQ